MSRQMLLIADDDADVRTMVRLAFEARGLGVLEAPDGPSAWELIITHRPRVVIADVQMPGLTGLDLCRKVKAQKGGFGNIKVVVYTAGMATEEQAQAAGCDGYFLKTIPIVELRSTVNRFYEID